MIIRQGLVCVWFLAVGKNLFMPYQMGQDITVLFQDSVSVRLKVLFWHKSAVVKGFGGWK